MKGFHNYINHSFPLHNHFTKMLSSHLLVTSIVLLSSLISLIFSCDCNKSQPLERQICRSNFAAKLWIRSSRKYLDYSNASYYRVRLAAVPYKMGEWADIGLGRGRLYTNRSEDECGRNFARNRIYVVTGTVDKYHNAWTSLCDYNKLSDEVSDKDLAILNRGWSKLDCDSIEVVNSVQNYTVKTTNYQLS